MHRSTFVTRIWPTSNKKYKQQGEKYLKCGLFAARRILVIPIALTRRFDETDKSASTAFSSNSYTSSWLSETAFRTSMRMLSAPGSTTSKILPAARVHDTKTKQNAAKVEHEASIYSALERLSSRTGGTTARQGVAGAFQLRILTRCFNRLRKLRPF